MVAAPDDLEHRIRRLEALFSVLLLTDIIDDPFSKEWDFFLRELRRPSTEADFFEHLYFLLRETSLGRRTSRWRYRIDELSEKQSSIDKHLQSVSHTQRELQTELHSLLIAQSMGLDPNDVPLHRFVQVGAYIPQDDPKIVDRISTAITELLKAFNFTIADDFPPEKNSWFKRWFAKTTDVITQQEVTERLHKVERAIELAQLQERQANIDEKQAKATKCTLAALEGIPHAVCLIGSILTVKITNDGIPRIYVRSLTAEEMIFLSKNQYLLKSPETILDALSCSSKKRQPPRISGKLLGGFFDKGDDG